MAGVTGKNPAPQIVARLIALVASVKWIAPIGLIVCLAGCTGSVLDPSPYEPQNDPAVLNANEAPGSPQQARNDAAAVSKCPVPAAPHYTTLGILTFADACDAAQKLRVLSAGYGSERNDIMREEIWFDVPMIGLGVAAIVNPLFNGARNATLALSLGAAGAAGGRLYFNPPAKVAAYNAAAQSLGCARSAASAIDRVEGDAALVGQLTGDISLAQPLSGNAALGAARDQAIKSRDALQAALANLAEAPDALQDFAIGVINATSNKIVGGVQNVSAVVSGFQAAATAARPAPATTPAFAPRPGPAAPVQTAQQQETAAELTTKLQTETARADTMTAAVTAALGKLAKCSTPS